MVAKKSSKVIDAEIVPPSTALAPATPRPDGSLILSPVMNLEVAKKRLAEFQEFVKFYLQEGEDFGVIPGTQKPTLYKPGADKLCELYGLGDAYKILTQVEDFTADPPLFDYTIECQLWRGDRLVSTGLGSCNSYESKYKFRDLKRVCPNCGKETVIKGRPEFSKGQPGYEQGGWVCWMKAGKSDGCGDKFPDADASIVNQQTGKVFNDDIATLKNTILKMGKKRSKIDATLAATRSSGIFTQDMEDIAAAHQAEPTGSKEAAQAVAERKIAEHKAKQSANFEAQTDSRTKSPSAFPADLSDYASAKPPEAKETPKASPSQPRGSMAAPPASIPEYKAVELVYGPLEHMNATRTNGAPLTTSKGAPYVTMIVGERKFFAFSNHDMSINGRDTKPLQKIIKELKKGAFVSFTAHCDAKGYWNIDHVLQLGELEWDETTGLSVLRRGDIPGQAKLL